MKKIVLGLLVMAAGIYLLPLSVSAQEVQEEPSSEVESSEESDEESVEDEVVETETADEDGDSADVENGASLSGDTNMITVSTEMGVQSVVSGKIPLVVRITPHVDSRKAQIRWDLPRGLVTTDPVDVWFEMEDGVTREFRVNVEPLSSGNFETVVDVTAWRYDTNYVSSATFRFDVDEDLVVTPAPEEYSRSLLLFRAALALMALIAIIVAIFSIKFGIKQFKQWLAED